ncbi:MAG: hypothetical protein ACEPOV_07395 [Hyphomicrobiales bacterium]
MRKGIYEQIIEAVLADSNKPLTANEIWEIAVKKKLTKGVNPKAKTPWSSLSAKLSIEINKDKGETKLRKTSDSPAKYYMIKRGSSSKSKVKFKPSTIKSADKITLPNMTTVRKRWHERELHHLLVTFAHYNTHFKAHVKTIMHEASRKEMKGSNEWLHPDLVGVYFPFMDYEKEVVEVQRELRVSSIKLFSFEMKKDISISTLRQYYFQAVSNSSWANEGYLVTYTIDDDPLLMDEIRRLNNAFGIGVIKLDACNILNSQILFPAKINNEIDWNTVNRMADVNKDFSQFIKDISEDIKIGKVKSKYDRLMSPEEIEAFSKEKGIIK